MRTYEQWLFSLIVTGNSRRKRIKKYFCFYVITLVTEQIIIVTSTQSKKLFLVCIENRKIIAVFMGKLLQGTLNLNLFLICTIERKYKNFPKLSAMVFVEYSAVGYQWQLRWLSMCYTIHLFSFRVISRVFPIYFNLTNSLYVNTYYK